MDKWETEFNERRYIKDKIWRPRVLTHTTKNLA